MMGDPTVIRPLRSRVALALAGLAALTAAFVALIVALRWRYPIRRVVWWVGLGAIIGYAGGELLRIYGLLDGRVAGLVGDGIMLLTIGLLYWRAERRRQT